MTTTTIITTLVLLAFLAALGAVVMFVYLAGQVGGAVTGAVMQASAGGTANDGSFDYPTVTDGLNGVKFIHAVIDSAAKDSAWVEL